MNTNLLYIPYRETDTINLGNELRNIIKKEYFQPSSKFDKDLQTITDLRNSISNLQNEQVKNNDELVSIQYYHQLSNVIKKFPDECVEFCWYGTLGYGRSGPTRSRSLKIEQLNILYQLGSYFSQAALKESRYTDEGLKKSCSYLQSAAGCFDKMISQVQKENEKETGMIRIPKDLQPETLLFLKSLMIAQAQETIWQKSLASGMKDSVIARLSIQTSEYYSTAAKYGNSSEFIKLEWINHVTVKQYHFKAAAHYRISILNHESFKYGEQVANLQVALGSCESAFKKKKYVNDFVVEDLQGLTETIKTTLRVAEKDNDLVYLKPVPKESDLPPISGATLVKSILPQTIESSSESNILFKELLPYLIVQVGQAYRERQDTFIRELFIDPIQSLNKMMYKFITERNLPASIDTIQKPENLPESIIQHSQEIISYGGTKLIEDSLNEIAKLTLESRHILEGCQERLKIEADEDDIMRERQGSQRWARLKSSEASAELISKINKMETYLDQAKEGDQFIISQYREIEQYLQLYCGGYKELIQFIPNSTYVKLNTKINEIIMQLRDLINEVGRIENQRKQFLTRIEIKARNNNILPSIIDSFKKKQYKLYEEGSVIDERSFEDVYERHITMFNSDLRFLEDLKHAQIALEGSIDDLNQKFESEYQQTNNESQYKRQEVLQTLENVYTKYLELISNLNEGSKFYSDFITKSNSVLKECDEYVYHRRVEGRELELFLNNQSVPAKSLDSGQLTPTFPSESMGGTWDPNQGIKFG
ncbi:pH-response regulator protein palA/RIM20 [Debaryomyces fabryi]|uniref:pH-response regulator protein palA/RIM20 n=1 Tax=Debaryomyces fabryi TaxID=58627 RepID=A0A0V1Q5S5_9ASCO|nr:pH-response regulator protein palA/RIM20 [Debaryomyces fabryi]KSA03801.1 pH-response regulator protein palA/RIM20 [Debaryomyces fabryi]CUM45321.1 unnamed protein product [Debaryomyces fabryi]